MDNEPGKTKTGINANRIKMTVRVDRELYAWLHGYCVKTGAVHNSVMLIALKYFRAAKGGAQRQA